MGKKKRAPSSSAQEDVVAKGPPALGVKRTRTFGILQILIGFSASALNMARDLFVGHSSPNVFGIWAGVWILVGGIVALISTKHPANKSLNGMNIILAVSSVCIGFFELISVVLIILESKGIFGRPTEFLIMILICAFVGLEYVTSKTAAIYFGKLGCAVGCYENQGQGYATPQPSDETYMPPPQPSQPQPINQKEQEQLELAPLSTV